jgi:hypothetical protein
MKNIPRGLKPRIDIDELSGTTDQSCPFTTNPSEAFFSKL